MTFRSRLGTVVMFSIAILLFGLSSPCHAQATYSFNDVHLVAHSGASASTTLDYAATDQPTTADPAASFPDFPASPQVGKSASTESDWHFMVASYLWLPWVYGTMGANGHDARFYATPGDLLSHFRFGLLGGIEGQN